MSHVFISYVRENRETVDRFAAALRAGGVATWLDRDDINPGQRWQDAIRAAIKGGDFFIACISQESNARPESYMNEEVTLAIEQLRLMPNDRAWFIPVVLDGADVPRLRISAMEDLSALQHVRLGEAWDEGISRILRVLRPHRVLATVAEESAVDVALRNVTGDGGAVDLAELHGTVA